ncbi:hypothetical protein BG004_001425, partial [Podila humilis]
MKTYKTSDLGGANPVFDGRANLFSAKEFPFKSRTFDVSLCEENPRQTTRPIPNFTVKVRKVANIDFKDLQRFLDGKSALTSECQTAIQAIDVMIRHKPSMQYTTVGRSFFTPEGSQVLSGCLEAWRGYYQSARPTPEKLMVNVDVTATAFFQSSSLLDMAIQTLGLRSTDDLRRSQVNWKKFERAITGLRVLFTHRTMPTSSRGYRINGLSSLSATQETFVTGDESTGGEETISVRDYFHRTYNRTLSYPMLPCIKVGKSALVPLEFCKVMPGQRYPKKLNEAQTADMIKFTTQRPSARANAIKSGLQILKYPENDHLKEAGITIDREMAMVPIRILPTPQVIYSPSSRDPNVVSRNGFWNLRDKKLLNPATLHGWSMVVFGTERDVPLQNSNGFLAAFSKNCGVLGLNVSNKNPKVFYNNPHGDIEAALSIAHAHAARNSKMQRCQLLLCVLPNKGVPLYAEIKRVSDTVLGVTTQCVQASFVAKEPKVQYLANVALKVNVKLGGTNTKLGQQAVPPIAMREVTLIVGADVNHASPAETDRPSIAVVVGSVNGEASKYAASIRFQGTKTEIISDFGSMVAERLKAFRQSTNQIPTRILVYRDGVSEGEFAQVCDTEVKSIRAGCQSLSARYAPKITFIVAQKRHHARLFPHGQSPADKS